MALTRSLPEAPISITAHIRVPHLSKDALLVTGRGDTADEAVANLHAAIAAVKAPMPHAEPRVRAEPYSAAILSGIAHATSFGEIVRIAQAAAYVLQDRIVWHPSVEDACVVDDVVAPGKYRCVTTDTCDCPEWHDVHVHNPCGRFVCAHMLAAQWWKQLNARGDA